MAKKISIPKWMKVWAPTRGELATPGVVKFTNKEPRELRRLTNVQVDGRSAQYIARCQVGGATIHRLDGDAERCHVYAGAMA